MKKMLAVMMVLCMMLSALCCTAFADDGYQIQVLDQDGYPVQGVAVQFCSDEQCMLGKTDEEGIAVFDVPAGSYTIHLLKVPAGYEKDSREYDAPETPDLVTLTLSQEVKPSQAVAAAGDQAKEAPDESEFVLDAPVVGLHFVTPESLRSLKGNLVWNADFIDTGVLNIPVEYYAVPKADMDAYYDFAEEYITAFFAEQELPEAPDPSWMSGFEDAVVYDLYAINEGRGEAELREVLADTYMMGDEDLASVTEIGKDGDTTFFLVQYASVLSQLDDYRSVMGDYYAEFESLVNDSSVFLSGLTLSAPQWPTELAIGDQISFETSDLAGNPVNSADLFAQAKVTMINLWATWCGPCKGELPELGEMAKEFEAQGGQLVGLCLDAGDDETIATAEALLSDAGAAYLNLRPMEGLNEKFPTEGYPTSFFVDSEGKLLVAPIVGAAVDDYPVAMVEALAQVG